ncbi:hypothetical protein PsAD2_00409 [Pseudovibrio axinellae]|uniref:Uncharacterized protein n=1 Tax=Pseudovibrio axinellae TaxID=989403 RepID=A0A166AHN8_9HYPH|nr:hypothetical protein [Pseudovibrio axinellae]KZL21125.1 hypothetical protein PsAD2_00409 [Pseudovibrio axinellae]SEQ88513.1 hypothetical protein SAMN05421798_10513 [Pseudovibrio axinellae]
MANAKKKIVIVKRTVCDGENVGPGDVVNAPEKEANFLINLGKAEETKKAVGKAKAPEKAPEPDPSGN